MRQGRAGCYQLLHGLRHSFAVVGGSIAVVILAAPGALRDRQRLAFLALLATMVVLDSARRRSMPVPTAQERLQAADADGNRYEAFYAAMLWSDEEPRGGLELARRQRDFGLYRTCAEQTLKLLTAPEVVEDARSLHAECLARMEPAQ